MPSKFSFRDGSLTTKDHLTLSKLTRGTYPGVNDPSEASAVAPMQQIDPPGDIDVIAVTLIAGQRYTFDIDQGAGDSSGGSVDIEIDLIDAQGRLIDLGSGSDGNSSIDSGSFSSLDPRVTFTIDTTGIYYIAVHSQDVDYIDGEFRFTAGSDTGDYTLIVSTPDIPNRTTLSDARNVRTFSDERQNVLALGGNDLLYMQGGDDIAAGGTGNDTVYGGSGRDELSGQAGFDVLRGGTANDVLVGGNSADLLYGDEDNDALGAGAGDDFLSGGSGNDDLMGHSGLDDLFGGSGSDFLRGGAGADIMYGGADVDTFHFLRGEAPSGVTGAGKDRIMDFGIDDLIDLSDLVLAELTYRGTSGFSGANQVRVRDLRDGSGNGYQEVRVNLDSDRSTSELVIRVDKDGSADLNRGDFIL